MGHRSVVRAIRSDILLAFVACMASVEAVTGQTGSGSAVVGADSLEVRVWVDRGDEPVVGPGDEVRVYYRVSADAYVAVFRIDTEGRVSLLSPQHPGADTRVQGGREYRLLLAGSARWAVTDAPGEGFFFAVASDQPLDFGLFDFDAAEGWDISGAGSATYDDPYQAIDDYVLALLPSWESVPYALDLLPYEVAEEAAGTAMYPYGAWEEGDTARVFIVPGPYPAPRMRLRTWYPPHRYLPPPPPRYPAPPARYAPRPPRYPPPPARYAPPPARYPAPPARYAPPPPRYPPCCRPPGQARRPRAPSPYAAPTARPARRPAAAPSSPTRGRPARRPAMTRPPAPRGHPSRVPGRRRGS
jgi:hypothetical protein